MVEQSYWHCSRSCRVTKGVLMDARSFTLGGLFNEGGGIQYMVPYFQRQYTWTKKDWQVLLEDVLLLCNEKNDDDAMEHFMGSVVIVSSGCAGSAPRYTL